MRKLLGLVPLIAAIASHWWWEFVRGIFYEKIVHQAEGTISWDWVVQYGLIGVLLAVALWLFWPEMQERVPFFGKRFVMVDEAARLAYEAAEKANALEFVSMMGEEPEKKLNYFRHVFLIAKGLTVHGVKPPSTNVLPIPRDEYGQLHPLDGHPNSLGYVTAHKPRYVNVCITRKDLRKVIRQYVPAVRAASRN